MKSICFYFQVHQPYRMRKYSIFDIGNKNDYFDAKKNKEIMEKVAKKCYLPANKLMLELIKKYDGKFRIAYSISGVFLEQAEEYLPEIVQSFKELAKTGCVEFLDETYHHSLSYLFSKEEFKEQVEMHRDLMKKLFNQAPKVFRNTELIFNNDLAKYAQELGYEGIIAEGADRILGWRSPNYIYTNSYGKRIKMLLKNYKLSDDIAFRFGNKGWKEYPLTAEKFAAWLGEAEGDTVNLFMDYETFGEHQWEDTGIFNFMKALPKEILKNPGLCFSTPSELTELNTVGELDVHDFVSWADVERDVSAWLGNRMQNSAIQRLYLLEQQVKKTGSKELMDSWRKLTTSDHFYYMCTKWFNDGDVHKYFNPYESPYDSFINFMNVLNDIQLKIKQDSAESRKSRSNAKSFPMYTGIPAAAAERKEELFY